MALAGRVSLHTEYNNGFYPNIHIKSMLQYLITYSVASWRNNGQGNYSSLAFKVTKLNTACIYFKLL